VSIALSNLPKMKINKDAVNHASSQTLALNDPAIMIAGVEAQKVGSQLV